MAKSQFYVMEYWPIDFELWLGHSSSFMPRNIDLRNSWIMARSQFYAMEYWPTDSELWLGHSSMPWNIDPLTLN